jgi:hypothetical protein
MAGRRTATRSTLQQHHRQAHNGVGGHCSGPSVQDPALKSACTDARTTKTTTATATPSPGWCVATTATTTVEDALGLWTTAHEGRQRDEQDAQHVGPVEGPDWQRVQERHTCADGKRVPALRAANSQAVRPASARLRVTAGNTRSGTGTPPPPPRRSTSPHRATIAGTPLQAWPDTRASTKHSQAQSWSDGVRQIDGDPLGQTPRHHRKHVPKPRRRHARA